MKKIYFILIVLVSSCISVQGASETKGKNRYYYSKSYKYDNFYARSKEERLLDIEFKLDILKDKYKRDKNQLQQRSLDKYDRKIQEKELKHRYKREEMRLKAERQAIKNKR